MPFSKERTQNIKSQIRERLEAGGHNDWELNFLNSMRERFERFDTKTRLSEKQYRTLHKLLDRTEATTSAPKQRSAHDQQAVAKTRVNHHTGISNLPLRKKQWTQAKSPVSIVFKPRRAIRRVQRKLFLPTMIVIGVLALIGSILTPPTNSTSDTAQTSKADNTTYLFVTGKRVNQRNGPSTSYHVMGQLTRGTKVRKVGDQGRWSHIVSPLGTGWMSSSFLTQKNPTLIKRTTKTQTANTGAYSANSISVVDGDTISIRGGGSNVRLVGFNTPETWKPTCQAELNIGRKATARLKLLIKQSQSIVFKRVACACKPGTEGTSQCNYGRQCGLLFIDGTDVGTTLIKENLAVPYRCGATSCPRRANAWCQ
jgi:endonuclease YncB( thermonuclease family)